MQLVTAVLLGLSGLALYLISLPPAYAGDDLQYATFVKAVLTGHDFHRPSDDQMSAPRMPDAESRSTTPVVNARYVLDIPTLLYAARLWPPPDGDVRSLIQTVRSFAGALTIPFFFLAVVQLTGDLVICTIVSIGLCVSRAFWTYSTHVDHGIFLALFTSIALYAIAYHVRRSTIHSFLAIASIQVPLIIAFLYNESAALLIPSFAVGYGIATSNRRLRSTFYGAALFLVIWASAACIVYLACLAILTRGLDFHAIVYGIVYEGAPEHAAARDGVRLIRALVGFDKAVIGFPGALYSVASLLRSTDTIGSAKAVAFYSAVSIAVVSPVIVRLRRGSRVSGDLWIWWMLATWLAVIGLFNWYWDPGYIKYWLIALLPWWVLVGLALTTLKESDGQWFKLFSGVATTLVLVIFAMNFAFAVLPEREGTDNLWLAAASTIARTSAPDALFISADYVSPLDYYLPYFAEREVASVGLLAFANSYDMDKVRNLVNARVEEHHRMGGPVYIYGVRHGSAFEPALGSILPYISETAIWQFPEVSVFAVEQ